ncbi:MAG: GNAT family N-acetyltransferase [Solirubrobacterales bacterium]
MLDIDIKFSDIEITNIQSKDLIFIQKWSEYDEESRREQLTERFLESCLSECEYFLKISKKDKVIGIIKGRVEFKNPNEAWIWFFNLEQEVEEPELDCLIMKNFFAYLYSEFDIKLFFTRVAVNDLSAIKFWKKAGFKALRVVKDYYYINGENVDMMIMENGNIDKKLRNTV